MPSRLMFVGMIVALAGGCAPHEDGESKEPGERTAVDAPQALEPEPEPEPEPVARVAKASIASVQLIEDCPDAPASPPPSPAAPADVSVPAQPHSGAAARKPGGGPISQPCTQSTMQLSFAGQGAQAGKVHIEAVRLLATGGETLATLTARQPTAWTDDGYRPWDETLQPETDLKASYKLSVPNWNDVDAATFVLEVDVEIDGQRQTIRSPEFVREPPHVIVT